MSCVISTRAMRRSRFSSRSSARICACTVTSSAVVGSSAISSCGSQASAIAIMTRWRMPPESSCGILAHAARRVGDVHALEQPPRARARRAPRHSPRWRTSGFRDLVADAQVRRERAHRILEDHRDARRRAPAIRARPRQQLLAAEARAAARARVGRAAAPSRRETAWVLPAPDSPTMPRHSPGARRENASTASPCLARSSKVTPRPSTRSSAPRSVIHAGSSASRSASPSS